MLIVCPSCASEYDIDAAKLGPTGRTVRCAACRTKFHVAPPPPPSDETSVDDSPEAWGLAPPEPASEGALTPVSAGEIAEGPPALSADASTAREGAPPRPRRRPPPVKAGRKAGDGARARTLWRLAAIAACLALLAAPVVLRESLVRHAPDTAKLFAAMGLPVNLRGLDFAQVRSTLSGEGRDATLVIEGEIANKTGKTVDIPPLAFAVSGPDGIPLYTWGTEPPRQSLGPGETTRFRSRLAAPPPDSRQVLVHFAPAPGGTPVARGP